MDNPKILLVGDLHIRHDNLEVVEKFFKSLHGFILSNKEIKQVVFMGDIFDIKGIIRVEVQNFLYQNLCNLELLGIAITLIVGNHDMIGNSEKHSFEFLKNLSLNTSIFVVDSPSQVCRSHNLKFFALPYVHKSEDFISAIDTFIKCNNDGDKDSYILLCHQSFKGFCYNNYKEIGDEGVDESKLDKSIKAIYSGHIHIAQNQGRVNYIGIPFTHNFGEANYIPRVTLVDLEDGKSVSYEINVNVPRHLSYDLYVKDGKISGESAGAGLDDFVRFVVHGERDELKNVRQLLVEQVKNLPRNLVLKYKPAEEVQEESSIAETDSFSIMLKKFINDNTKSDDNSNLLIQELGDKILNYAMSEI